MRRVASLTLASALLIALFLNLPALANEPSFLAPAEGEPPVIEVLRTTGDGLTLAFELTDLAIEDVTAGGQDFQLASIPGGAFTGEVGEPAIPTYTRLVAIPTGAGVRVRAIPAEIEEQSGQRLVPMQAGDSSDFAFSADAYARDSFDTALDVTVGTPMTLRDLRVVRLAFQPVHYNPASQTLKITRRMEVEIEFSGTDPGPPAQGLRRTITPSFDRIYRDIVVNYTGPGDGQVIAPGSYLVICNASVVNYVQPLVDWRQREGYSTILATTTQTGGSATSIKNYIQGVYDDPTTNLEYVCLVGDVNVIPCWFETMSGYSGEGDHEYTLLDGADVLSDVHIGRLSYSTTTDLQRIIAKSVRYETEPWLLDDPEWFTRAAVVGDPRSSHISVVMANQWVKSRLLDIGYTEVDTVWSDFTTQMQIAFDKGDTFIGYRGWLGMSGWSNGDTYSMRNGRKMPFAVIMTCDTGSFADGTALSEGFLRAGVGTDSLYGAVGAIGTATWGTHTRYNNCIYYGVWRGLLWDEPVTPGAALTRGKLELFLNYQDAEPNKVYIWSVWNNVMGDPAVELFTGYPKTLLASHPASLALGANAVLATVTDAGEVPIEGAQVCLSKGSEVHVVGYTNGQGQIDLPINPTTTGGMHITVTKHNARPYLKTISVATEPVFVGYLNSTIDDDNSGGSSGNGDGVLNPGETIELKVQFRNFGTQTASNVSATLTSNDPHVQILDDQETLGAISGGATVWTPDDFDIVVDPGCPNAHVIQLALDAVALEGQWHSLIELAPVAADLTAGTITLYNSGNGRLDPGEELEMSVQLTNEGAATATDATGRLVALNRYITVTDAIGSFGTIGIGGTGTNSGDRFRIAADPSTYQGNLASFLLVTEFSGGIIDTTELQLTVGIRSSTDPVGPDRYGYYAFDNTDTSYPEAPTYGWIEIDPNFGGDGTHVVLGDYSDYQDKSRIVDLPFPFQYYGQTYTEATICSNGWIAMGTTYLSVYRNWTIPGAGGPDAMLAVFWDDLKETTLSPPGRVYQKYDASSHLWIVQWSRMRNDENATETFQAILYDPVYYPTDTGDGMILYQYNTVVNNETPDGYATVGIESPDQSDGVLYTYYARYPLGAATLTAGRAIKFVPVETGQPTTGLGSGTNSTPLVTGLDPGRPNPFNPWTTVSYRLSAAGEVKLRIYDVAGRLVKTLESGFMQAGEYELTWDGRNDDARPVASGEYFLRLDAPGFTQVRQLTLVR